MPSFFRPLEACCLAAAVLAGLALAVQSLCVWSVTAAPHEGYAPASSMLYVQGGEGGRTRLLAFTRVSAAAPGPSPRADTA